MKGQLNRIFLQTELFFLHQIASYFHRREKPTFQLILGNADGGRIVPSELGNDSAGWRIYRISSKVLNSCVNSNCQKNKKVSDYKLITAYWDTAGLKEGKYYMTLKLFFKGKTIGKQMESYLGLNSLKTSMMSATGQAINADAETNRNTILSVAIIILILVNIFWFFYFRKKLNKKKK